MVLTSAIFSTMRLDPTTVKSAWGKTKTKAEGGWSAAKIVFAGAKGSKDIKESLSCVASVLKKDRMRAWLIGCSALIAFISTSGIPVIGLEVGTLPWLLNTIGVVAGWLGLHTLRSHNLRISDFFQSGGAKKSAAHKKSGHLLSASLKLLLLAIFGWAAAMTFSASDGGLWLLLEAWLFTAVSISATVLTSYETGTAASREAAIRRRRKV